MAGKSPSPCIVWFRDDLRLSDHPALHAASMTGAPVICLYVFDDASEALPAPELAQLPARLIHQPWSATPLELNVAGIELGNTFPEPIIDHKAGRERALKAYAKIRAK